jgi:Cu/Ag efflux pump CusA
MPLLLGCFAVIFPRVVLFLVWLFGNGWLERAINNALVLLLGFLLMPLTTLAYAYAVHSWSVNGSLSTIGWVIVAIGVLVDLGSLRGGHKSYYRRRELD